MKLQKNRNHGKVNKLAKYEKNGIIQFLEDFPDMNIVPSRNKETKISGIFKFSAEPVEGVPISDSYHLDIKIADSFPDSVPVVFELDQKIPRDGEHHINSDDTICLGSPLRLKLILSDNPTLIGFTEKILVPFLYSMSHHLYFGGKLPAEELSHGEDGIVEDYSKLFELSSAEQIKAALRILGTKRRIANKMHCPCNCGKRYANCKYRNVLEKYRHLAKRSWFRAHSKNLDSFVNILN